MTPAGKADLRAHAGGRRRLVLRRVPVRRQGLSPADVLLASASFRDVAGAIDEPANRLLMDPVLQFQPWLEFNRTMLRQGRLPLWNDHPGCGAYLANASAPSSTRST